MGFQNATMIPEFLNFFSRITTMTLLSNFFTSSTFPAWLKCRLMEGIVRPLIPFTSIELSKGGYSPFYIHEFFYKIIITVYIHYKNIIILIMLSLITYLLSKIIFNQGIFHLKILFDPSINNKKISKE